MNCERNTGEQPDAISLQNPLFCVFRSGLSWFALPALVVQEVMPRPDMVYVPGTPESFIGLCHVRSEFIPVLNLKSVLVEPGQSKEPILLILDDSDGPWGFLTDEVVSLQHLEISDAPESIDFDTVCAVIGWATFGDAVIKVLDKSRIRQIAEQELAVMWQSLNPLVLCDTTESSSCTSNLS